MEVDEDAACLANNIIDEYQEEQCACDDEVLYSTDEETPGEAPSALHTHSTHPSPLAHSHVLACSSVSMCSA